MGKFQDSFGWASVFRRMGKFQRFDLMGFRRKENQETKIRSGRLLKNENPKIRSGVLPKNENPKIKICFGFGWIVSVVISLGFWICFHFKLLLNRLCFLTNSRFFNVDGKCFGIEKQKMKYYICRLHCMLVLNIL
ncbi:unnamed protein product [Rhizophagus irregularis]|nr:unnamed protein product [Rhizophagus irregularis]